MTTFLATIKEIFTWCLGLLGNVVDFIIANPILLIFLGIALVSFIHKLINNVIMDFSIPEGAIRENKKSYPKLSDKEIIRLGDLGDYDSLSYKQLNRYDKLTK